jgi:RNA polymerase sigma factor (sigma-70 family)
MKQKGTHISNPFAPFSIPRQLPPEELSILVKALKDSSATPDQIQQIYFGHMRLGIAIACRIGTFIPHLIADMVSEAMLALLEGIRQAQTDMTDDNITPYLSVIMKRKIIDFLRMENVRRTLSYSENVDLLSKAHERIGVYQHHLNEILEQVEHIILEDDNLKAREYKRVIVRLKSSGYSIEEVADILGMTQRHTRRLIQEVSDRYFELV